MKENYLKNKTLKVQKLNKEMSKKNVISKKLNIRLEVMEIIFEFLKVLIEPKIWYYAEFF